MHELLNRNWMLVLLFLVLTVTLTASKEPTKCLINAPQILHPKYPNFMSTPTDVVLATSDSALHQLSTEIFKIFLEEVMGFRRIKIVEKIDSFNITYIADTLSPPLKEEDVILPEAMLNLQVWLPWDPEFDITDLEDTTSIKELGNLIPAGRFGWFIPRELSAPVKKFYGHKWDQNISEVHWSMLRDRKLASYFEIDGEEMRIVEANLRNLSGYGMACTNRSNCENGIFTPAHCKRSPCGLLLTSDYNTMRFVVDHITELELYVKVAFLGSKLQDTVRLIRSNYKIRADKSLLILHYTPGEVVLREKNFISVTFKNCEILSLNSIGCKYGLQRIVKLAWNKIETIGLLPSVRNFRFNEEEYERILDLYETLSSNHSAREIGCEWMKENKKIWQRWKTESDDVLYIGGIFPVSDSSYNGPGIVAGARMARGVINGIPDFLSNYKIEISVADGKCRPDKVMKAFIDYTVDGYYNKLLGVLGPACSDTVEPLAGVSKHYKIMVISYSAEGASFSDREKYPYFFRTIGENKHYKHVYIRFFKKLKWTRVASLTEDGQKYTEYISHMQEMLEENGITFIANIKFPRERENLQMTRYLEDLQRKRAKIIILDVVDDVARTVMCQAFKMKMTSAQGYVWFLPHWLNDTWYDTDFYNPRTKENVSCSTQQMHRAINGYFSMSHAFFAPNETEIVGNMTVKKWREMYSTFSKGKISLSKYAGYAYDAVWTYALALDKLIKTDPAAISDLHSENTTAKIHQFIKDTDFTGVSGRIKFRGGPSRFSEINLVQWYNNNSHTVATFYPKLADDKPEILDGNLTINASLLKWFTPDGEIPGDGTAPPPVCTLDSLAKFFSVDCEMAIVVLNLLVGSILILIVTAMIYVIKKRYDKKVKTTQRYMRHLGIDMLLNPSNLSDLDKWEIPRNAVVINRKLGEGAFGTVYGGEANLPEKGWVAVAVKTLKVGSTTEEKLDFLSEAEVMKRFEHKNIVKLLGVCTKEEPVYTIMEFMLYGDLKTFLLARRHLVNDKSIEESDEISSKKLTGMALDVARGLSYLASLKYVHRDVASRNCLVNAQRVVKLGDFGMTRPMLENDYYRFTRKGMLPVRWMSPESLALGVFTPASDVWSFGVLLYEIITFGSFPYQGMNNQEVLEFVKNGETIKIPEGVKPQLKCLLKSCWQPDTKDRIRASEIVEFLANNPRLLAPCLDVPLSSVQLEDTGQEINLPDQFRKCSTSDIKPSPSVPNGIATHVYDQGQESATDSGVGIPLENCCPKEPLLGHAKSSSSLLNFGKYVTLQHNENGDNDDEDYVTHNPNNGFVISQV